MAVAHINALDLLGKKVQFIWTQDVHSFECTGTVTDVLLSLSNESQISIDDGEFYCLSDLLEFKIL